MSSTHDTQRREDTSSNEPARDTSTSSDIPTAQEPTTSRVSDDTQSSPQHTNPSEEHVTPEQQQTASAKPADSQPPLTKVIDVDEVKERLRTWSEGAALVVRDRADRYTAVAVKSFAELGRELNKVTGYGEIESLKQQVAEQERRINAVREAAREAKVAYEQAVQERAKSQRDVNDLLQRKSTWTDEDVGRFTALVRQDHLYEQAETRAKLRAMETEEKVEREFTELMRVILNRYHEEQVWSDKIRSASTYGSLTVLGLNLFIFVLAIIIVEPWKRKRLAQTFEKKVEELSAETIRAFETKHDGIVSQMKEQEQVLLQLIEAVTSSHTPAQLPPQEPPTDSNRSPNDDALHSHLSQPHIWAIAASATVAAGVGWIASAWFSS